MRSDQIHLLQIFPLLIDLSVPLICLNFLSLLIGFDGSAVNVRTQCCAKYFLKVS